MKIIRRHLDADYNCSLPGDPNAPLTRGEFNALMKELRSGHAIPVERDILELKRSHKKHNQAIFGTEEQPELGILHMMRWTFRYIKIILVIVVGGGGVVAGVTAWFVHVKDLVK